MSQGQPWKRVISWQLEWSQIGKNRRSASSCGADWKPIVFMHLCLRKVMKMTVNLSQEDKHTARIHTVEMFFVLVNKQTTRTCFFVVIDAVPSPASKDIQDEEEVTPILSLWWHPWFPPFFFCCPHPWLQGVFIMVNSFHLYITSNVRFSWIFLLSYHSLQAGDPVTQRSLRFPLPSNAAHPEQR